EAAGLYASLATRGLDETIEEALPLLRRGAARKARTRSFARVGDQGELRNREQRAGRLHQRDVHAALRVGKDAVAKHPLGEARGLGLAVVALDADEREDAGTDRGYAFAADRNGRLGDALDQRYQAMMSGMSRVRRRAIWSLSWSLRFLRRCSCRRS